MFVVTQRIRVEWSHCDPAGIIFNPNYYIWMDQGTHGLLTAAGFDFFTAIRDDDTFIGCPLVASELTFKHPLRYGDETLMRVEVSRFSHRSFTVTHRFERRSVLCASGSEVRVWAHRGADDTAPIVAKPIPETIVNALSRNGQGDISP